MTMKYIHTPVSLAVQVGSRLHNFHNSHENFLELIEACERDDEGTVLDILLAHERDMDFNENVFYKHGILYVRTPGGCKSVDPSLTTRIMKMFEKGASIDPLLNFISNLSENPDYDAISDMYRFLDHNELPITDDGYFIAYKVVRDNYRDKHSGKFDNSVGQKPSMPRAEVQHDREVTCSSGLHFCSKEYLPHFGRFSSAGDRVMVLKINPRDVVSIPTDYNNAKGRTCMYEVINELPRDDIFGTIERLEENVVVKVGKFLKGVGSKLLGWIGSDSTEERDLLLVEADIDDVCPECGDILDDGICESCGYEE